MRLTVKKDQLVDQLVADYLARGGSVQRAAAQNITKTLRKGLSLNTRHVGKHNRFGQRV